MTPTVAIGSDFLEAFARIPRAQQRKVRDFTEKFKANPKSAAIHYEKIQGVKDDKVRTVRIDQKYRAVVLHPDQGDVYVLVWVDNHDEAMDWAKKRTFAINPHTGALQIINVIEAEQAVHADTRKKPAGLFASFGDDVLLSFGLPDVLLPAVRAVRTKDDLLALSRHLPAEASEALTWLAEGVPPEEVKEAVEAAAGKTVDTADLATALEHPDTRRRFVAIQSDADLAAMLDAPLAKWRVFLHPSQDKLVKKHFNGPARVLGGAGTGKTVVAMHRARYLAETVCTAPEDRVLFTTFTANLAQNVEEMLATLCPDCLNRIEVVHLHAWAMRSLRDHQIEVEVADPEVIDQCWEEALNSSGTSNYDLGFLKLEWDQIVQTHGIEMREAYLKVPRTGRGKTLSRLQRTQVWTIFDRYRQALKKRNLCEWLDVIRQARRLIEQKGLSLPYRAVVVDESQDFHPEEWKLLRALVPPGPNDMFLVGDAHQRIYGRKVVLKDCGINIQGRSSTLKINYRTTEQIRSWATGLLRGVDADDLDGGKDEGKGYRSLLSGPKPECRHFATAREEQEFLAERLHELLRDRPAEEICLVARTARMLKDDYQSLLKAEGIPHTVLGPGKEASGSGVRLATLHRVKGLEFPAMIVAGVNARVVPMRLASVEGDPTAKAEHEERERSLLFVAATRARDSLTVTSWGTPSPFLAGLLETQPATAR
jgi:superfamily I DNA/RNA helicase